MKNSNINFKAAFGKVDADVRLWFVSGIIHPTYQITINKKEVGIVRLEKITLGGPPTVWRCLFNDNVKDIFTSDDAQILIEIASHHYEKYINK